MSVVMFIGFLGKSCSRRAVKRELLFARRQPAQKLSLASFTHQRQGVTAGSIEVARLKGATGQDAPTDDARLQVAPPAASINDATGAPWNASTYFGVATSPTTGHSARAR